MKYYVVWKGAKPGIYESWEECQKQVKGYKGAIYKAFQSRKEAEKAFNSQYTDYIELTKHKTKSKQQWLENDIQDKPIADSVAVDAACSGNPGPMEYRGVYVKTGQVLFHIKGLQDATNNIGEFLAIVHALAFLQKRGKNTMPIYSDSQVAINWVKQKKCKTTLKRTPRNQKVFELIARAEKWLQQNIYQNPIIKWNTKLWGEIPADFGRK